MRRAEPWSDDSLSVLVCDDVASLRALLRAALETEATRVVGEAADGEEAVALAAECQPDVVLLDLNMPRRTGLEALPEIRRVAPDAKVVVLTGFEASGMEASLRRLGADDYIEKGLPVTEVVERVVAVARGAPRNPELEQEMAARPPFLAPEP